MGAGQAVKTLARPAWHRARGLVHAARDDILASIEQVEAKVDDLGTAVLDRISFHGKLLAQLRDQVDELQAQIDAMEERRSADVAAFTDGTSPADRTEPTDTTAP